MHQWMIAAASLATCFVMLGGLVWYSGRTSQHIEHLAELERKLEISLDEVRRDVGDVRSEVHDVHVKVAVIEGYLARQNGPVLEQFVE